MKIAKTSTRATVYEALLDIFNSTQRDVTPTQIMALTGFNKFVVNDQLEMLINEDQTVIRMTRGYFQPVIRFPETRAMSRTILSNGLNKFEVGDLCLELTPAEGRMATVLFGGGNAIHEAEAVQQNRALVAQQAMQIVTLNRNLAALARKLQELTGTTPQVGLEFQ